MCSCVLCARVNAAGRSLLMRFLLKRFRLKQLQNLYRSSNLCSNFRFNATWHTQPVVALVLCRWLVESDVSVTLSVTCMHWLCEWYNHAAHQVSSPTAIGFLINMSEKHISTSPSAIQVENRRKTIHIEEKLHTISRLEKGERIVDIFHNVMFTHSSVCKIHDNAH
jgi:hypothetical protein